MRSSSRHLRPGSSLLAYPEREAPKTDKFEQLVDRVRGERRRRFPRSPQRFWRTVRRIGARGRALGELSEAELSERVREARRVLVLRGLANAACIDAFALIREQAERVLGMRPYDVQILGGWAMLQGMVAEMQTGEGKTLAATLPAATAAMAGMPVHVITVNDYLVRRDAELMEPLYRSLGLSVGTIVDGMEHADRRAAYACDIVYCTNKQLVFDYLRDRMVRGGVKGMRMRLDPLFGERAIGERLLLRGLCFAILDEADSVLVDEARTPLIISRGGEAGDQARTYEQAHQLAEGLESGPDYRVDLMRREVEVTEEGKDRLQELVDQMQEALPVWSGKRRREELVRQALYARELLLRDRHYLVKDDKIQIIDEYTGRLMPDRSWDQGLHQLVETKEGCEITVQAETLARISFQRFFRRYLRLAGMTGTAREVVAELWSIYHLELVTIPTNRPLHRRELPGRVYATADAKWRAVVEHLRALNESGVPVLVGTTTVGASEHLSGLLDEAGLGHQVLNARQDSQEAKIVAQAGQRGRITVATNMAGRGTDIKLSPGVADLGGLHVLATERHEAGRIDRQLYGRCGRQGDPGSFRYHVSLQDDLVVSNAWRWLVRIVAVLGPGPANWLGQRIVGLAQRRAERRHATIRRALLRLDEQVGKLLAFSGRME